MASPAPQPTTVPHQVSKSLASTTQTAGRCKTAVVSLDTRPVTTARVSVSLDTGVMGSAVLLGSWMTSVQTTRIALLSWIIPDVLEGNAAASPSTSERATVLVGHDAWERTVTPPKNVLWREENSGIVQKTSVCAKMDTNRHPTILSGMRVVFSSTNLGTRVCHEMTV